jgi:outer membrane lipoprotein-sorting protein
LFSEGHALYLWQIRHIPNVASILRHHHKAPMHPILRSITAVFVLTSTCLAQSAKPADYLKAAQERIGQHRTIRAEITELVGLTEPPYKMTGTYLSAGLKLRLNYQAKLPSGASGQFTEISDGERLWSLTELPGSKRVTRRDLRQILAAVESAKMRPERAASVDLALGGLPALLSSVQRTMDFDAMKEETDGPHKVVILQGKWNEEWLAKLVGKKGDLPAHIPDSMRLYFAADTAFPERLVYLKQQPNKKYKPLLDLQFRNVVLDGPVDDREFDFTPPEDVEPEDVTRQYLDQLFPKEEKPAAATK